MPIKCANAWLRRVQIREKVCGRASTLRCAMWNVDTTKSSQKHYGVHVCLFQHKFAFSNDYWHLDTAWKNTENNVSKISLVVRCEQQNIECFCYKNGVTTLKDCKKCDNVPRHSVISNVGCSFCFVTKTRSLLVLKSILPRCSWRQTGASIKGLCLLKKLFNIHKNTSQQKYIKIHISSCSRLRKTWSLHVKNDGLYAPVMRACFLPTISSWSLTMLCTTDGSARVEMSPSSSDLLAATFRRIRLIILPDRVFGRPVVTCEGKKDNLRFERKDSL